MKRTLGLAVASVFTVIVPAAHAAYDRYGNYYDSSDYRDTARVIDTHPVYANAGGDECWNNRTGRYEARPSTSNRVGAGAAVGAIAGGVLGNKIESDRREDQANADFDLNNCRQVAYNGQTLEGYDVRYSYRGQEYVARMNSDPGNRLVLGRDIREDGTPYDFVANSTYNVYNEPESPYVYR